MADLPNILMAQARPSSLLNLEEVCDKESALSLPDKTYIESGDVKQFDTKYFIRKCIESDPLAHDLLYQLKNKLFISYPLIYSIRFV
jgi:hypothetical protein